MCVSSPNNNNCWALTTQKFHHLLQHNGMYAVVLTLVMTLVTLVMTLVMTTQWTLCQLSQKAVEKIMIRII